MERFGRLTSWGRGPGSYTLVSYGSRQSVSGATRLMRFVKAFFGGSNGGDPRRYLSEDAFREILAKQTAMSPATIAQLQKLGVTDATSLKLEFFFYTDTDSKAQGLENALKELQYEAHRGPSASDPNSVLINGWTTSMKMDVRTVVAWTEEMCRLGFMHDCEFDGWGTSPKQ